MNISSEGETMMEITRQMATRTSRSPFYPHIKVIIVSEEIAKTGEFANVIDFFLRDHEMRRGTKVLISQTDAKKSLEVKPHNEKLPAMYIDSVAENNKKTARMSPPMRLGDLHQFLLSKQSYTLPRITAQDKEVKIAGVAVFQGHENKMVGWLGEEETEGLGFLGGDIDGGVLKINIKDNLVIYEIKGTKREIQADVSNKEHIKFTITIESEGNIPESLETIDYLEEEEMWKQIEKKVEDEIERMSYDVIEKLQKELAVDAMGLGAHLHQNHHQLWESIKDDWDRGEKYFTKSDITVKAKVIVRNPGVVNKTEPKEGE